MTDALNPENRQQAASSASVGVTGGPSALFHSAVLAESELALSHRGFALVLEDVDRHAGRDVEVPLRDRPSVRDWWWHDSVWNIGIRPWARFFRS